MTTNVTNTTSTARAPELTPSSDDTHVQSHNFSVYLDSTLPKDVQRQMAKLDAAIQRMETIQKAAKPQGDSDAQNIPRQDLSDEIKDIYTQMQEPGISKTKLQALRQVEQELMNAFNSTKNDTDNQQLLKKLDTAIKNIDYQLASIAKDKNQDDIPTINSLNLIYVHLINIRGKILNEHSTTEDNGVQQGANSASVTSAAEYEKYVHGAYARAGNSGGDFDSSKEAIANEIKSIDGHLNDLFNSKLEKKQLLSIKQNLSSIYKNAKTNKQLQTELDKEISALTKWVEQNRPSLKLHGNPKTFDSIISDLKRIYNSIPDDSATKNVDKTVSDDESVNDLHAKADSGDYDDLFLTVVDSQRDFQQLQKLLGEMNAHMPNMTGGAS